MKTEIASAGEPHSQSSCEHTLHLTNVAGQPIGSWVDEKVGDLIRVVCRGCGRFYGYRRSATAKQAPSGRSRSGTTRVDDDSQE